MDGPFAGAPSGAADQPGGQQQQRRPQPLAAALLQILTDLGDDLHRRDGLQADLLFHALQIVVDQVEDLLAGDDLPELAQVHWKLQFSSSRSKFAVVTSAMRSGSTPRTSARRRAVSTIKAGSLRLPRLGTGAR